MRKSSDKKTAVVLLNMGGPNNLFEVEVFLKNMFNDPLILPIKNNFVRKMVANMIINKRIDEAKQNYSKLDGKSPLVELTFNLTGALNLADRARFYTYAMRYTPPFSDAVIKDLMDREFEQIILFSMYPQYSNTTILSSLRDFMRAYNELNCKIKVKIIERYPDDFLYIKACVENIKSALGDGYNKTRQRAKDFVLLLSAHSIPQKMIDNGDIYQQQIEISANAIKAALISQEFSFKNIHLCYQSKLGPIKWLSPDTKDIIKQNANENIIIFPLAFSIDNSETKYELDIENRTLAEKCGVKEYIVCECLNDSPHFVCAIINLINTQTKEIHEITI